MIEIAVHRYLEASTLAPTTRGLYRHYLLKFVEWAAGKRIDLRTADPVAVSKWFAENPSWADSTKASASAALREFYRYQFGANHPMTKLKVKRAISPPQRTMVEDELSILLATIDTSTPKGVRDIAIITLLADSGLRATEISNLEMKYLDIKNRRAKAKIKGGDWGDVYFFDYTASCIGAWLAVRPYYARPEAETVFVGIGGNTPGQKMTRYGMRMMLFHLSKKAGIENVSPHAMRRTFATIATEIGAPTRLVQTAGRWRSIRMVEHYTQSVRPEKLEPFSVVNHVMGIKRTDTDQEK